MIDQLQLQKLVFLSHAFLLVQQNRDVVEGEFVAWKAGPVHRDVYDAFKSFGRRKIDREAQRIDRVTGKQVLLPEITDQSIRDVVIRVVEFYGAWSGNDLVRLTHSRNGPWDRVIKAAANEANLGLRISNDVIRESFKFLWFGQEPKQDEQTYEDQPLIA